MLTVEPTASTSHETFKSSFICLFRDTFFINISCFFFALNRVILYRSKRHDTFLFVRRPPRLDPLYTYPGGLFKDLFRAAGGQPPPDHQRRLTLVQMLPIDISAYATMHMDVPAHSSYDILKKSMIKYIRIMKNLKSRSSRTAAAPI